MIIIIFANKNQDLTERFHCISLQHQQRSLNHIVPADSD